MSKMLKYYKKLKIQFQDYPYLFYNIQNCLFEIAVFPTDLHD